MRRALLPLPCMLVGILTFAAAARGSEPIASFALDAGWVEAKVHRDGAPVEGATLRIFTEHGEKFGEGATSSSGDATFPLPPGSKFVVEIQAGDKSADPITVLKGVSGLQPARVLLTFGLRPCCRGKIAAANPAPAETPTPKPEASPLAPFAWVVAFAVVAASGMHWFRTIRLRKQTSN